MELREYLTPVSEDGPEPVHKQVANQLRTAIATGKLKAGEQLPQGIRLADWFGTSLAAVNAGLVILTEEGLTVPGLKSGVFVRPSDAHARAEQAEREHLASLSKTPVVHDMWALDKKITSDLHKIAREIENLEPTDLLLITQSVGDIVALLAHTMDAARRRVGDYRKRPDRQSDAIEIEDIETNFEYANNSLETAAWLISRGRGDLSELD